MSRFYISYFYQIRFFPGTLVPVSTAVWDPKWYHNNKGNDHIFIDKRFVINGIRCPGLSPTEDHIHISHNSKEMCGGPERCEFTPDTCAFMSNYRVYLNSLNFDDCISKIEKSVHKLRPDADICLMVYETPDNPCSERHPLQQWFMLNGILLQEWDKTKVDEIYWR